MHTTVRPSMLSINFRRLLFPSIRIRRLDTSQKALTISPMNLVAGQPDAEPDAATSGPWAINHECDRGR